jgi:Xaa-Pro aminopeptidase
MTAGSVLNIVDVEPTIHRLQRCKDADELATMRAAIRAAEAGYAAARRAVMPGMTELDAYLLVQSECQRAAGRQAVVYGDFVSGPRCETGGGPPSDRRIERGDLLLLDFSVVVRGYRGDFAGTFAVQAKASDRVRAAHAAAVRSLEIGERALAVGNSCAKIAAEVRDSLDDAGFGRYFKSHVGHGLGLGHPDPPYIVAASADTLEVGDVVTLEPGVFVPGEFGLRVERNYFIGASGVETLTRHDLAIDGV